jgi:hypothetical protein
MTPQHEDEALAEEYASRHHHKEDDPPYGGSYQPWFDAREDFLAGRTSMREENEALRLIVKEGVDMAEAWECSCNSEYEIICWRCEFLEMAAEALQQPTARDKGER